ncbi:MAG: SWIM zinc finger family protein [Deltaproteobacteria bacterium]|nr:SWIM zinc finger family protein [Deltaproteobacteria bacterium]
MYWSDWTPRPTVAQRRALAAKETRKRARKGETLSPVEPIAGRQVAESFWGQAWCTHLEGHADYSNRLPRGRSYVRNGSVLDLKIAAGKVHALVQGSSLYTVEVTIRTLAPKRWKDLVARCAGRVDSVVELLRGSVSDETLRHLTDRKTGMFPAPAEMSFSCSCPDWADMCKHVAAALYGVGARLDRAPELLFTLRNVDQAELVKTSVGLGRKQARAAHALQGADLGAVFGIELEGGAPAAPRARRAAPAKKKARKKAAGTRRAR